LLDWTSKRMSPLCAGSGALRPAGVENLATRLHLRMTVQQARRGREAIAIELL